MPEDWDAVRAEIASELPDIGTTGTLHVPTATGDAWNPTISIADHAVTVVGSSFKHSEIDGTRIRQTDRLFLVSNTGAITPDVSHRLTVGGVKYSIINVVPVQPAATALMWKVQARI